MPEERELLKKVLRTDDPALNIIYLDEIAGRLEEISDTLKQNLKLQSPVQHALRFPIRYQTTTIAAGQSRRIYYLRVPTTEWVGIITEVANGPSNLPFDSVYFTWLIDGDARLPDVMRYSVAAIDEPKPERIAVYGEIEWIGYNDDDEEHDFEVVCDGFFMKRDLYEAIMPYDESL